MDSKKLTVLGITALIMVLLAVVITNISNQKTAPGPERAFNIVQGLDPALIASVELGNKGAVSVKLPRNDRGVFTVSQNDGYPAVTKKVNELITMLLDIKTTEGKFYTNNQANHKDLGVTEADSQKFVKFAKKDGSLITGIIIGNQKQQGKGSFIRLANSDEVYVTDKVPHISDRPMSYIDEKLTDVDVSKIVRVTVSSPNDVYTLSKQGGDIVLKDIEQGKKLISDQAENVFEAIKDLSFENVTRQSDVGRKYTFDHTYVCELDDTTVYTLSVANEDDGVYVSCKSEYTGDKKVMKGPGVESEEELKKKEAKLLAMDKSEKFSVKHFGWIYKITSYKAKNVVKPLAELLEDEPEEAPESQPAEDTDSQTNAGNETSAESSDKTESEIQPNPVAEPNSVL